MIKKIRITEVLRWKRKIIRTGRLLKTRSKMNLKIGTKKKMLARRKIKLNRLNINKMREPTKVKTNKQKLKMVERRSNNKTKIFRK